MTTNEIALVDVDGHHFPNLALMKISTSYKKQGFMVKWFDPLFDKPSKIFAGKVFTFTPDYTFYPDCEIQRGGSGYDAVMKLPDYIEKETPDYSLYPQFNFAIGFLTRGCIRNCPWCIVPKKEGNIHVVDDIENIQSHGRNILLLDNNFLAADDGFVSEQLEKASAMQIRIDFNQGLDCRLVSEKNAGLLAKTRWIKYIRFSCDTQASIEPLKRAVYLLRRFGYKGEIFVYVLAQELNETLNRICKVVSIDEKITPFCQPYRNFTNGQVKDNDLKRLARWCNIQSIRKTIPFLEYGKIKAKNNGEILRIKQ